MTRALIALSVAAISTCAMAGPSTLANRNEYVAGTDSAEVRQAVLRFIHAIDRLDLEGVANSFAKDAVAFYPFSFTGERLTGRDAITTAQQRAFVWARRQLGDGNSSEPLSLNLNPTDMQIRMLGDDAAVVTWHSNRPAHYGRRSAVLERIDGEWLIIAHHASNISKSR